jgi:sugar/nucleoside kinase (ribokinase family)
VDTLGAGDVFHGACVLALAQGRDFEGALRASPPPPRRGQMHAFRGSAAPPNRAEVEAFLAPAAC